MNISVALASYNGQQYISEQLDSILSQLEQDDEIIISDDGSVDGTVAIIKTYQKRDKRIHLIDGPKKGFIKNFENALMHCNNEIIFLSDQDDIWLPEKRQMVIDAFVKNSNAKLVIHDYYLYQDGSIMTPNKKYKYKKGVFKNLLFSSYYGCIMCLRKSFLDDVLPFPSKILTHDQWIGIYAETQRTCYYLNRPLIYYRRHNQTVSKNTTWWNKIRFRVLSLYYYILNYKRIKMQG